MYEHFAGENFVRRERMGQCSLREQPLIIGETGAEGNELEYESKPCF